jgi:transposase
MQIDPDHLPDDKGALQEMVRGLVEDLETSQRRLRQTQHLLEQLLRHRYGARRERVDENQLFLFAAGIVESGQAAIPPPTEETPSPQPKRRGHGRKPLPASLERRRVVYDLAEHRRYCPECGEGLQHIGEETSERLEYVPASFHVIEEACQKYACRKGCTVVTADKPRAPIDKGRPGPGLLAQVAVSKYADHLPLYRQEGIYRRQGVGLSRQTLCGWMRQCADLVHPLYARMKREVLNSKVVGTDDTPVHVLDRSRSRTRVGRIWTYVGDDRHPYTVYDYTPNRSRAGPEAFLDDFTGYLQADAYVGYDQLYQDPNRQVVEVACWAHARRKFFEAQSSDVMRSTIMPAYIRLLYDIEREARKAKLTAKQRYRLRHRRSGLILDDIHAYLEKEREQVLPKSPIGVAVGYALSNWRALVRYLDDGDLEIDNNPAERSLRGIAIGRKNWMFYGSDNGGRTGAVLTSLIATCRRHGIEPFSYLRDVFERIGEHPHTRLDELLPDRWQAARATPPS